MSHGDGPFGNYGFCPTQHIENISTQFTTHCQLILYLKNVVRCLIGLVLTVITLLLKVSVVRQLCTAIVISGRRRSRCLYFVCFINSAAMLVQQQVKPAIIQNIEIIRIIHNNNKSN